jgi:hypothetical protein
MRRTCGRVLTWLAIGAFLMAGAGCGCDPPPGSSPTGGGEAPPGDLKLAPGAAGEAKGDAGGAHPKDQKAREF